MTMDRYVNIVYFIITLFHTRCVLSVVKKKIEVKQRRGGGDERSLDCTQRTTVGVHVFRRRGIANVHVPLRDRKALPLSIPCDLCLLSSEQAAIVLEE